jgi:hypothetical protein
MANYIKLDSSKRLNYAATNPGEFILPLSKPLSGTYSLKQVVIPLSYFNINATNNIIPFYENATAKTAVLTPGYYSDSDLLVQLASAMTATSAGFQTYTVTRSALPMRITIAGTQNFQLLFGSNTVNSAAEIIGFMPIDTPSATSQLAQNISNLSTLRSFSINLNMENGFSDSIGNASTFVIPILGVSGAINIYEPPLHFQQRVTCNSSTSNLRIKVTDDNANALGLCSDWYMILQKEHHC